MSRLHFLTSADEVSFPATVATINSALQFHPNARVSVVCNEAAPPTPAQRRIFAASDKVRMVAGGTRGASWPESPSGSDKARACHDLGIDGDVVAWIDPGCVLCSSIDDVAAQCREAGGLVTDSVDDPMLLLAAVGARGATALIRWVVDGRRPQPPAALDTRLWCPRECHWVSIIDYRDGQFVNVSASRQRQRMFCCVDPTFASWAHRERVVNSNALQTYPYVWFLAMLWFGRAHDWSQDPFDYLPPAGRHLFDDLIYFLPQIVQVLPRARYEWNRLTNPMITRALDGVPRMLALEGSMTDVLSLVALHPWIRRYVEIGSYEGGSILTLALRFMVRDIDFYAVESFMGSLDGTTDGGPLPSRKRFLDHLARFPGLRVRLVPGDSAHAAALFDDESLDCVFIDGCHDTPAVLRDIDVWMPKLKRPSIIAGDDYNFESVFEAVKTRFSDVNITRGGAIWWVSHD